MHLTLKAISKNFGTVRAVDAVSLEVADGELFFLVGPSGCGKTTLLRMIAGFCQPDSGAVLFDGIQVNQQPAHLRNTGMVFQNYALWPHLTVADNVAFGLAVPGRRLPEKDRRARVQRMLQAVHMEEFAERKPNQLSGGQQQRVALARALVVEPACLLLDEPLSNLDAKLRLEMRIEIRRLVKQIGITTIYVTHDQAEALSMADRCLILKNGRVAQIGTPRDIYQRPANRFVADFIGGANLIPGVVSAGLAALTQVNTSFGKWLVSGAGNTFQAGQKVLLCVRQEAIELPAPHVQKTNVFPANLTEALFFGDHEECRLSMSDGTELKALRQGFLATRPPAALNFWVDPSKLIILADP